MFDNIPKIALSQSNYSWIDFISLLIIEIGINEDEPIDNFKPTKSPDRLKNGPPGTKSLSGMSVSTDERYLTVVDPMVDSFILSVETLPTITVFFVSPPIPIIVWPSCGSVEDILTG